MFRWAIAIFIAVLCMATLSYLFLLPDMVGSPPPRHPTNDTNTNASSDSEASSAVIRVLFATDRARGSGIEPGDLFGSERGELNYGYCDVSIPRDHRMGQLESPSIWRLQFKQDRDKHVVLLRSEVVQKEKFFDDLATRSSGKGAFVFVPGFNVTFEDGARRTAQISYDLGFDGVPVLFSWPSRGSASSYVADEQAIEWSQANLKIFLEDFLARSDAKNVYLIAHSMGNRALTRAIVSLIASNPILGRRITEVILTAPDIDAAVFSRDIAPALISGGNPITLYASSADLALTASKKVHGFPRIGDSGPNLVVSAGIETIDASGVDTSLTGHSYYAENRSVLADMFYLIRNSQRPDSRFGLLGVQTPAGRYWKFRQ